MHRQRICRAVVIAAVLALTIAPPADAARTDQPSPASPALVRIVERGAVFWRARGVVPEVMCPTGVAVALERSLEDIDDTVFEVMGRGAYCEIWLLERIVRRMLRSLRGRDPLWARLDVEDVCEVTWHELGHAYGLDHSRYPSPSPTLPWYPELVGGEWVETRPPLTDRQAIRLMDGIEDGDVTGYTPPGCVRLARAMTRQAGVMRRARAARRERRRPKRERARRR